MSPSYETDLFIVAVLYCKVCGVIHLNVEVKPYKIGGDLAVYLGVKEHTNKHLNILSQQFNYISISKYRGTPWAFNITV